VTTALDRVAELFDPDRIASVVDSPNGYLDLLGEQPPRQRTLALSAMRSKALPMVYERWWRPVVQLMHGPNRLDQASEQEIARELLNLHSGQTVLDVACGPGNFTRSFAPVVGSGGLVVGFDESATMLAKAVEQNTADQVGYVRGDARALPFRDETFDAVGCFLALHLIPEPFRALDELIRVVAPGGRIAIMASYRPGGFLPALVDRAMTSAVGIKSFERGELTGAFRRAGMVGVEQRVSGLLQFVSATKPGVSTGA
jgi:ubiquinone/menaquinone biosynthesis C-methylase UbiE